MRWIYAFFIWSAYAFTTHNKPDPIYYVSLNYAVHKGFYYPTADVGELLDNGDFGLGSEEELASEMVILDGRAYGFASDGSMKLMDRSAKLAFGAAKFFKPEKEVKVRGPLNYRRFIKMLDSVTTYNGFSAIRVDAHFSFVKYHCYVKQEWPYKPTRIATLVEFRQKDVEGTLVGFHTPKAAAALNSPDYHFHFINSGRTHGGHLDKCVLSDVTIQVDYADRLEVHLPDLRRVNIDKVKK